MNTSDSLTSLVVLFNHQYNQNIPIIRNLYSERYSHILQLMPYYNGNDDGVFAVYGNSYQFYNYILQAREQIKNLPGDYILIVADDLLLNPDFNEHNSAALFGLKSKNDFYLDGFVDISLPLCRRGVSEVRTMSTTPCGIDSSSVNSNVPSYEIAREILKARGLMAHDRLSRIKVFPPILSPKKSLHENLHQLTTFSRSIAVWLYYRIKRIKYPYPVVFGFSDIICVPKNRFDDLCLILGVFSAWNMFVELAIPTALQLLPDATIKTLDDIKYKSGNVFYPYDLKHKTHMEKIIGDVLRSGKDVRLLAEMFPKKYLYLHPVKLSQFSNSL